MWGGTWSIYWRPGFKKSIIIRICWTLCSFICTTATISPWMHQFPVLWSCLAQRRRSLTISSAIVQQVNEWEWSHFPRLLEIHCRESENKSSADMSDVVRNLLALWASWEDTSWFSTWVVSLSLFRPWPLFPVWISGFLIGADVSIWQHALSSNCIFVQSWQIAVEICGYSQPRIMSMLFAGQLQHPCSFHGVFTFALHGSLWSISGLVNAVHTCASST